MAEQRQVPGGMAGITSYDVNPERFTMKPGHVVGIVLAVVALEAVLFYGVPVPI